MRQASQQNAQRSKLKTSPHRRADPTIQQNESQPFEPRIKKQRPGLRIFAVVLVSGVGFVYFTETGKNGYTSVERALRVITTLYSCIGDYRRTLKERERVPSEEYEGLLKACHKRCAERTLVAMEKNGSIFIKLGQHLSSLNYLLPTEWCDTFIPLQDQCPVSSFESIRDLMETDTGMKFADIFSEFQKEPLGAASLAQVHLAVDKETGQKVAVKVQHPVLDYWAPLDIVLTEFAFKTIKRTFPQYDLTWLSDEMQISLPQELDFALEGENAMRARSYFSQMPRIPLIIPNVLWARRRILVMEYVTGARPDDLDYLDSHNISRDDVSATLARIFNTMIFSKGAPLHCDPHGGNIAIRPNLNGNPRYNFDIILYDHGLYRIIPQDLQRNYAHLWLAVMDADEPNMRKYAQLAANINEEDFPLFASAITGRDYRVLTSPEGGVSRNARTKEEEKAMSDSLSEGMIEQLIGLLGKVPRIILLILKTNDLTRSLDQNLKTTQGPVRSFLILARYAAQTVWEEQVDFLRQSGGLFWPPGHALRLMGAWTAFMRIRLQLAVYESLLYVRGRLGLRNALDSPVVPQS